MLNDTESLVALVEQTPVTVEEWRRQRATFQAEDLTDPLKLGFSAFFLNRTNRSGVIGSGGVIGGLKRTEPIQSIAGSSAKTLRGGSRAFPDTPTAFT